MLGVISAMLFALKKINGNTCSMVAVIKPEIQVGKLNLGTWNVSGTCSGGVFKILMGEFNIYKEDIQTLEAKSTEYHVSIQG